MKASGIEPELPELTAPHLIGYLWEVGPVVSGGMGAAPVSFCEIQAWQASAGLDLSPWELRLLRKLSNDYLAESHAAEEPGHPSPWEPEQPTEINREAVSRKVQNIMKSFIFSKHQ